MIDKILYIFIDGIEEIVTMKVIQNLEFQWEHTAVCIGKFDGIHRGHRLLISHAAKQREKTVMFTFSMGEGKVLYAPGEKRCLAKKLGVDYLVEIPFDDSFRKQTPEDFAVHILKDRCGADKVIVGRDFRFGKERSGDTKALERLGEKNGFDVVVYDKLILDGEVVSSTRIRNLIQEGRISEANHLLGTPYFISGIVTKGNQLGRTIQTPTANVCPASCKVLPPFGVYAVLAEVENELYYGVSNLGVKPTIADKNPTGLEVWLFEYEGDLYGKEITVYLIDAMRREQKFASLEQLKTQIQKDTIRAKEILALQDSESLCQSVFH